MKNKWIFILMLLLNFNPGCGTRYKVEKNKEENCILSFEYFGHDAVGPESLVNIVQIHNNDLKDILLNKSRVLVYKYTGGIYNIDTLYFPKPLVEIYNYKDSSFIFDQSVFKLRQYQKYFMDSIMELTKNEIAIEVIDTLTNRKWNIVICGK